MRGTAALLVALYHINPDLIAPTGAGRFVGKGYLWVDLFFVLSGFLLAMNYADRFAGGWSLGAWLDFLLHRLARIYPLYLRWWRRASPIRWCSTAGFTPRHRRLRSSSPSPHATSPPIS